MGRSWPQGIERYRTDLVYLGIMLGFCLVSLFPVALFRVRGKIPSFLLREDGLYESAAALACLGGSLLLGWAWLRLPPARPLPLLRTRRNVFAGLLALVLLFLFLEEISWGQRLLGIEMPAALRDASFQNEINVHNLTITTVGGKTSSDRAMWVLKLYILFLPILVAAFASLRRLVETYDIPVPSLRITFLAWVIRWLNAFAYDQVYGDADVADVHHIGEIFEGNMEALLLLMAAEFVLLRRASAGPSSPPLGAAQSVLG